MTTKTFFAYIRVSTAKQGQQGSSLHEQRAAIEAYATRNDLEVVEWFEERVTAAKRGRSVFNRMLRALEAGKADGVIIHKIDRSARNLRDWADLADLIDRGADVHFAHDALDLRSRGGRLSADIQAVVAADFIRNLREETRKGFYGRLKQGLYPLKAPIGYLDRGRGQAKKIDPITAPLVREMFELYATMDYTFEELRREMFKRGLKTHSGQMLSKNGLTTILNNPFYVGLIHIRKTGEVFEGAHAPLITKALYDQVQAVLHGKRSRGVFKHDFLFRRLIKCAECGYSLVGERQKGKYVYYRCHTHGCVAANVSERVVDELIRDKLQRLTFGRVELGDFGEVAAELRAGDEAQAEERKDAIRMQVVKCEERLSRLTDALLDGIIDKEAYDSRKATLLGEKRTLMDELAAPQQSFADQVLSYLELANTAYSLYESASPPEKRALVENLTSNFSVRSKTPAITLKSPFQDYLEWLKSPDCDLRPDRPRTHVLKVIDKFKRWTKYHSLSRPPSPHVPANDNWAEAA